MERVEGWEEGWIGALGWGWLDCEKAIHYHFYRFVLVGRLGCVYVRVLGCVPG